MVRLTVEQEYQLLQSARYPVSFLAFTLVNVDGKTRVQHERWSYDPRTELIVPSEHWPAYRKDGEL